MNKIYSKLNLPTLYHTVLAVKYSIANYSRSHQQQDEFRLHRLGTRNVAMVLVDTRCTRHGTATTAPETQQCYSSSSPCNGFTTTQGELLPKTIDSHPSFLVLKNFFNWLSPFHTDLGNQHLPCIAVEPVNLLLQPPKHNANAHRNVTVPHRWHDISAL